VAYNSLECIFLTRGEVGDDFMISGSKR